MAKRVADAIFASAEKSHDETMRAEVGERALKHAMEKGTLKYCCKTMEAVANTFKREL